MRPPVLVQADWSICVYCGLLHCECDSILALRQLVRGQAVVAQVQLTRYWPLTLLGLAGNRPT